MFVLVFLRFFPTRLARVVTAKVPIFFVPATPLLVLQWLDLQACFFAHCGRVCESFPFVLVGNGCTVSL